MRQNTGRVGVFLGAVTLMALVGCGGSEGVLDEVLAEARQAVGMAPDFVVTEVSGPASVRPGQFLRVSVEVCNQGTYGGSSTGVDLYLSVDPTITVPTAPGPTSDIRITSMPTGPLDVGQCRTLSMEGSAYVPQDGAYYLGALVDQDNRIPELLEDNNTGLGNRIGVGSASDFIITAVSGPTSARTGQSLAASVTVCNQGTYSDSTFVELYLSANRVISPPPTDHPVGVASTNPLYPGQCQTLVVSGTAQVPTEAAYYLGAAADPSNGRPELIEDNNTWIGNRIGIGSNPDFVVTSVTGPASARSGQSIPTHVTVCNQGTSGGATDVVLYLSSDAVISPPDSPSAPTDQPVSNALTDYLTPGQCQTLFMVGPASVSQEGAYYLGAIVDPGNGRPELIENNNSKAGNRIGIGARADFIVTAVSGPVSAQRGQPITASVSVCNQGTSADSTQVALYVSSDSAIVVPASPSSYTDQRVGNAPTGILNPGQCTSVSVSGPAQAPLDGAYYLGAVVDSDNYRLELIEDNNTKAGNRIGIGSTPDFFIKSVSGPVSAEQSQLFSTTVVVCNQGTYGGSTDVELLLSVDTTIAVPTGPGPYADVRVTRMPTGPLNPGQCTSLSLEGSAYVPEQGAYYLGAIVDQDNRVPELIEDNNVKVGNRIGVGSLADFYVKSVSGPTSSRQGQSVTASTVVCNQGTEPGSTYVELFLSSDTVITRPGSPITPADFYLGSAAVDLLYPGQCQTLAVSGPVQAPMDGAWYLGAIVNPTNRPELIADNNTKAGNRIGVGSNPDFVVTSVTGPTSAQRGQSLTSQVTVCNQGTYGGATDVALYLSSDAVITLPDSPTPYEDQLVTSVPVSNLNPGQCQTLSMVGPSTVPADGAYYLGALVDPNGNRPELIEDNNAKTGSRIGLGSKADFIVTAVSGPVSAQRGQPITASVSVCNQGTSADSTQVALYVSSDSAIVVPTEPNPYADRLVGNAPTGILNPGQCTSVSVSGPAQVPMDGVYYLGAAVDPDNSRLELIEDNNTKAGNRIGVGSNPDFFIKSVSGPVSVEQGQLFSTTVVVCNQGTYGGSTDVELLLSVDTSITVPTGPGPYSDVRVTRMPTGPLNPGQCTSLSLEGQAYVPEQGAYYLGAIVDQDNRVPELIEDNNSKASINRTGVGSLADFYVKSVSGPTSAQQGQPVTASTVVCNQGTEPGSTYVELYLSPDTVITRPGSPITPADFYLGGAGMDLLYPGQCQTLSVAGSVSVPTDGAWYLGAIVNPSNRPELIADNNTKVGNRIGVGARADFAVTSVSGPASALRGQAFTTSVKVCNQGTRRDFTDVALYVSSDAVLDVPESPGPYTDQLVTSAPVGYLDPGQCRTMSMSGPAPVPADGAYYLAAVVDLNDSHPELIEDNNIGLGNRIGLGSKADFIVTAVSGPVSAQQGQPITASVTACNQGTSPDSTQVGLYLSSDLTLVVPTEPNPYADQLVGSAPTGVLNPGQCISLSVSGPASVPMEGAYYLGAAVDPDESRLELIEDNNTKVGTRIGVGTNPDFIVKSVTGPTSAQQGQVILTSVVVCNQGTYGASTDVELLLSMDSTIAVPTGPSPYADIRVSRMPTGLLNPGQCQTLSMEGQAYVPQPGAWYLGAIVDQDNYSRELLEDNNTKAGTVLNITP